MRYEAEARDPKGLPDPGGGVSHNRLLNSGSRLTPPPSDVSHPTCNITGMTTVMRRVAALSTALILALAGSLALASPANAEAPPANCAAESVCGYVNTQYRTNQGFEFIPAEARGVCVVVSLRNAWSGVYNNSGHAIRLFRNTGCTGTDYKEFANGTGHWQFSVRLGPTWDNSVDAVQFR